MANEPVHSAHESEESKGDIAALLDHMKQNPLLYTAAIVFLAACALVGVLYRMNASIEERKIATTYARAIDFEDPAERAAALEEVASGGSALAPNALYMRGEAAFDANDFELAKQAFGELQSTYPNFEHTPDAVEGIGFIAEDQDDVEGALAQYEEVLAKWPNSFAGRRQPSNIGRCMEHLGRLEDAVQAYQNQLQLFPGSSVALKAQQSLERLRTGHPELFPEIESILLDDLTGTTEPVQQDDLPDISIPVEDPEADAKPEGDAEESSENSGTSPE